MPGVTEVLCAELLPSVSIQGTRILHAGVSASPGASPPPGASHGSRTGQQRRLPAHGPLPGAGPLGPFQKSVCVCVHCVCVHVCPNRQCSGAVTSSGCVRRTSCSADAEASGKGGCGPPGALPVNVLRAERVSSKEQASALPWAPCSPLFKQSRQWLRALEPVSFFYVPAKLAV